MSFSYLRHPLVLLSLLLTFVNDQYVKYAFPGLIAGKISDFAGLFYFPFFLYAVVVFVCHPKKLHADIKIAGFVACLVLTEILFVILKFSPLREPFIHFFSSHFFRIGITPDLTDLWALTVHVPALMLARQYRSTAEVNPNESE